MTPYLPTPRYDISVAIDDTCPFDKFEERIYNDVIAAFKKMGVPIQIQRQSYYISREERWEDQYRIHLWGSTTGDSSWLNAGDLCRTAGALQRMHYHGRSEVAAYYSKLAGSVTNTVLMGEALYG